MSAPRKLLTSSGLIDWETLPIGTAIEGGFFMGVLAGHAHILAPWSARVSDKSWAATTTRNPDAYSLTDSKANTDAILASDIGHPAAEYCRGYMGGGYSDWDLGATDVMNLLWINRAALGVTALTTYYWTSTAVDSSQAKCQRYSDGYRAQASKTTSSFYVIPVRRVQL